VSQKLEVIAVDFDGTLCAYCGNFPAIGAPNYPLINFLRERRKAGAQIILWTCREEKFLEDALAWCAEHGLEFDAVNENAPISSAKTANGTAKRKIYATLYIDDRAAHPDLILGKNKFA
jgi:hypothetical protein